MGFTVAELERELLVDRLQNNNMRLEVEEARGSLGSLTDRLDVSLNQDGTLRPSELNIGFMRDESSIISTAIDGAWLILDGDRSSVYVVDRRVRFNDNDALTGFVQSAVYDAEADETTVTFQEAAGVAITAIGFSFNPNTVSKIHHEELGSVEGVVEGPDVSKTKHISDAQLKDKISFSSGIRRVATLAALTDLTDYSSTVVYMAGRNTEDDGGQGTFTWNAVDLSAKITSDSLRGIYVAPAYDLTGASGAWVRNERYMINAAAFDINATNSEATNVSRLKTAAATMGSGVIIVPRGTPIDWNEYYGTSTQNITVMDERGSVIVGDVGIRSWGQTRGHLHVQSTRKGFTRFYVQPKESPLGVTGISNNVVTSLTAFFEAFDDQQAEALLPDSDWTGAHYRDGGVSCLEGPQYAGNMLPAGIVLFNAKMGGNWWPYRPGGALSISEIPMATAMQIVPGKALPGPTFAGGKVYPSKRWTPNTPVVAGQVVHEYGRFYEVLTTGTTGTTPPLHDGIGGRNADAWDAGIKTVVGTSETIGDWTGYTGYDGGGVIKYALLEQTFGKYVNVHRVLALGNLLSADPAIGLGDGVQLIGDFTLLPYKHIRFATVDADGVGTHTDMKLWVDEYGVARFGTVASQEVRISPTVGLQLRGAVNFGAAPVKTDGAATHDVSTCCVVKFRDTAATDFTGFTNAKEGQVIHVLMNNANTTLKHSASLLLVGGADIVSANNRGITFVMRTPTIAQMMG